MFINLFTLIHYFFNKYKSNRLLCSYSNSKQLQKNEGTPNTEKESSKYSVLYLICQQTSIISFK